MGKLTSRSAGTSPARHAPETMVASATAPHRAGGLLLALVLGSSAFARPAGNVDAKSPAPESSAPVDVAPSRLVDPDELAPYLESLSSKFLIRERARDPFGQIQDLSKPTPKAPPPRSIHLPRPAQTTPFSEIVQKISITTVMPGEKRVLIGTRSFKLGDQIPLGFRGKTIQAQITEVTSKQISFRNPETGENATRRLDLLPAGMTSGSREITVPGMIPNRPDAPIELEAGQ